MKFREFMIKCNVDWSQTKYDLQDYEIDYLFEKAREFGYDLIDLARRIADTREKYPVKRSIIFQGMSFANKRELAEHLGMSYHAMCYQIRVGKIELQGGINEIINY